MNRSPLRLTPKGAQWLKKSKALGNPLTVKIKHCKQISPKDLTLILKKHEFPFLVDSSRFITYDPDIISYLILCDNDFNLFLGRKNS